MATAVSTGAPQGTGGRGERKSGPKTPVLKTTRYDLASAAMIAVVIAMVILVTWVTALWLANLRFKPNDDVPMEMVNLGGFEDGAPDETLKVESPEDPTDDPSVVDTEETEANIEETVETVVELSDNAAQQVHNQAATSDHSTGKVGSKEGTGRRPLGNGPGEGGRAPHLRWFIKFDDKGTLDMYARQLDYFGIELGLYQGKGKGILLLSNMSRSVPTKKVIHSGKEKGDQMYFTWAGGGRKKADVDMFRVKAGLNAKNGIIMHFYPQKTVRLLLAAEKKRAGGRSVQTIKRTYFVVRKAGSGYEFFVTRITFM